MRTGSFCSLLGGVLVPAGLSFAQCGPLAYPPGTVPDTEPCGVRTDGPCADAQPISIGIPVHGTLWAASQSERDGDVFHVPMQQGQSYFICGQAEQSVVVYCVSYADPVACTGVQVPGIAQAGPCQQFTMSYTAPQSGDYFISIALSSFGVILPCQPSGNNYWLSIRTDGRCPPSTPPCPWAATDCVADFNGSGGTPDDADIAAFFVAWNNGDDCADANNSGGAPDDADIAQFFNLWNAGGCS